MDHPIIDYRDADTAAWLAALLATYAAGGPAQARGVQARLSLIGFADIVGAIERAGPAAADKQLLQDWIAGNPAPHPHLFAAWFNLGVALARDGDRANAAVAYANARALKPDFYAASVNLGLSLEAVGQTDAALQAWEGALQGNEARTTLLNQRARLLEQMGRLAEAEAVLRTSLLTDPAQPDAAQHWLHIRQKTCRWPVLQTDMPGLPAEVLLRCSGPLGLLALTDEVARQRELAAGWMARKMPAAVARLSPAQGYRHARIRVGYLSSDFCRHAMSYLIAELFERHDRARFEVFGYCSTIEDGSAIRRRVLASFDHVRDVRTMDDAAVARLIRADEIDILIDLNGLTAHTRLAVLRWRPAPVQATYLGFVGPVPLPELDFLLCDDFVIPPEQRDAYQPVPLSVAPVYQANDSKRTIGTTLSRAAAGLPDGWFVFCCFSNHYKITEAMFAAWMRILRAAEHSVLWLAADNEWSASHLRAAAEQAGVAADRIVFAPRADPDVYMSRLALADLFLDTFPYNAGTIASDAIRMKLPLLTLCGQAFASRMAGCFLNAIGARQGIAGSVEEYVEFATRMATDAAAYAAYRLLFAGEAWSETIGDIAGFTAAFEATLERVVMDNRFGSAAAGPGAGAGGNAPWLS